METITYSLKNELKNSEAYYKDIHVFTDDVSLRASGSVLPIVSEYMDYLRLYNLEEVREREEYLLELLSFGILRQSYADKALAVRHAPFITLARMAEWRKKHQRVKPFIDFVRGIFITFFLLPVKFKNQSIKIPVLEQVDHVCKWFEATGEFKEQALRFIRWRAFWSTKSSDELTNIFLAINEFTLWFEEQSKRRLGKYTQNVNSFLEKTYKKYLWREDRISCSRVQSEYHLNMVGAELMNRAFRSSFNKTKAKVVIVPGCLRIHNNEKCEAKRVKEGLLCDGCSPQCRVNQLRILGKNQNYGGFEVYIIPHASDLSQWSSNDKELQRGVIASACVTTLVEGGWELKRYDIPAQCVLLDYCGCKKHWHHKRIQTSLNVRELKRIVQQESFNSNN